MKRYYIYLLLPLLLTASCSSPYLGRRVNLSAPAVCLIDNFPSSCSRTIGDFSIDYTIAKIGNNLYEVEGIAKKISRTSGTFTDYSGATFTVILVQNGITVETVNVAGGSGSFDRGITFKREFSTEIDFEATIFAYSMQVKG